MPYVSQEARLRLETGYPETAGELNYEITKLLIEARSEDYLFAEYKYLITAYVDKNGKSYQTYNDIIGATMGAGLEYHRRTGKLSPFAILLHVELGKFYQDVIAPYEDGKIKENGDVYPKELTENGDR